MLAVITPAAEAVDAPTAVAAPASAPAHGDPTSPVPQIPEFIAADTVPRALPIGLLELRPRPFTSKKRVSTSRASNSRPAQRARAARLERRTRAASTSRTADASRHRTSIRRPAGDRAAAQRPTAPRTKQRTVTRTSRATKQRTAAPRTRNVGGRRGMSAVIAYARAQVGKRYARGGAGPHRWDCSGLTMRAYARVGLRLPHSSGGQAARARTVSRARAVPGDLVVGPGHVGVYLGGGLMVDAGNPRTGVVIRPLYAGLHIERL